MTQLAQEIERKVQGIDFLLPCPKDDLLITRIKHHLYQETNNKIKLMPGKVYNALSVSQAAIVCSGTASLECVLWGVPLLLLYKTSWLSYLIGRFVVTIPYLGIANVISSRFVHKEFIQKDINMEPVCQEAVKLITDQNYRKKMIDDFRKIEKKNHSKRCSLGGM